MAVEDIITLLLGLLALGVGAGAGALWWLRRARHAKALPDTEQGVFADPIEGPYRRHAPAVVSTRPEFDEPSVVIFPNPPPPEVLRQQMMLDESEFRFNNVLKEAAKARVRDGQRPGRAEHDPRE